MKRRLMAGAALTGGVLTVAVAWGFSVQPERATQPERQPGERQPERLRNPQSAQELAETLIRGLKATEGCLGAEAAQTMSGRNTIIGWFENKAAVKRWYHSETHQRMLRRLRGSERGYAAAEHDEPLAHVEDEDTPIMVMATLTFAEESALEGVSMPISQLSIELYSPLPGGVFMGQRLAPEGFEVPHMENYTPQP